MGDSWGWPNDNRIMHDGSGDGRRASSLLPLWEKVARTKSVPDEGSLFLSIDRTPHPSAMLRIASTLSHKGRGEASSRPPRANDETVQRALPASRSRNSRRRILPTLDFGSA